MRRTEKNGQGFCCGVCVSIFVLFLLNKCSEMINTFYVQINMKYILIAKGCGFSEMAMAAMWHTYSYDILDTPTRPSFIGSSSAASKYFPIHRQQHPTPASASAKQCQCWKGFWNYCPHRSLVIQRLRCSQMIICDNSDSYHVRIHSFETFPFSTIPQRIV